MLKEHFADLTDKRQTGKVRHNLLEMVVMTICAVIAGCDCWEDIADYCGVKENWFREKLGMQLVNGIASHDTLARVWAMIQPTEFERCFRSWVSAVCQKTRGEIKDEIISIDGKTARGSGSASQSPLHMVSAWANQQQLVLAQVATDAKSNEITAVPQLLDVLDITGCIITADAMSCQKEIVRKIADGHADYVLSLKDNQPTLRRDAADYFAAALAEPKLYPVVGHFDKTEKQHGRTEQRNYYLVTDIDWLEQREDWHDLRGLGLVHSKVTIGDTITEENRLFITSLTDVHLFAKAVRAHWGIENSLHWCLDMTFREDNSRIRKDHSAENFAVIRHLVLNILKQLPDKMSIARKRRRCSYDDAFLEKIFDSVHA
jgi:predicted transposase YbfD/YdcC